MRLLLDTHVLLWWLAGHPRIRRPRPRGRSPSSRRPASLEGPDGLIAELETEQFRALPVILLHAVTAGALPRHHAGPFDRMLVLQAQLEDLTLVTSDQRLHRYAVQVLDAS